MLVAEPPAPASSATTTERRLARTGGGVAYLDRLDDASREVAAGLASAEHHDALFDIAQLLLVRAEIERRTKAPQRVETLQDANRILQRLGMIAAPRF